MIVLDPKDRPHSPEDYDKFVSADVPKPGTKLHELVKKFMIHTPCTYNLHKKTQKNCIDEVTKKCVKYFPYDFSDYTKVNEKGVIYYKRRNKYKIEPDVATEDSVGVIDSRWVVPYNPYLLLRFNAHINVIIPNTENCIKYLYQYVLKERTKHLFL